MAFVKAASHSNIKVECFIDRSRKETKKSWEERKIDECNSGIRTAPVGLAVILGTIFQEFNVKVHYSTIDCDDTVAAFAYHKGGCVLSRDRDFFRYFVGEFTGTPPYKIYYGFSVKTLEKGGTHLKLICRDGYFNVAKGGPKSICNELPKTNNYASSLELEEDGSWNYVAGCGSNITHLPNPYYRVKFFHNIPILLHTVHD